MTEIFEVKPTSQGPVVYSDRQGIVAGPFSNTRQGRAAAQAWRKDYQDKAGEDQR